MFSCNFLEGNTARSSQCPYKLALPDDDPEALEVLLNMLHFSRKEIRPGHDIAVALLKVADKYDCVVAIHSTIGLWLHSLTEYVHNTTSFMNMIVASYLAGLPDLFTSFTRHAASDLTEVELSDALSGTPDMPTTVQGEFPVIYLRTRPF